MELNSKDLYCRSPGYGGGAILRNLTAKGFQNIITRTSDNWTSETSCE
jgi:hypothetical protein